MLMCHKKLFEAPGNKSALTHNCYFLIFVFFRHKYEKGLLLLHFCFLKGTLAILPPQNTNQQIFKHENKKRKETIQGIPKT